MIRQALEDGFTAYAALLRVKAEDEENATVAGVYRTTAEMLNRWATQPWVPVVNLVLALAATIGLAAWLIT